MFWGPTSIGLQESVCEDDQLSHDGCEGELGSLSCVGELVVLGLHVRIEAGRDEGWHVDGLADSGSASSDEAVSGPAAGLPGDWREAGETCRLAYIEGAELGHFDEQGEGGDGRHARNAGQDGEPLGEIGASSDLLEDCRLDRRHLAIELFEALRILTLQQGGQNLAAVLGGGAVLHQGFAGQVKLLR